MEVRSSAAPLVCAAVFVAVAFASVPATASAQYFGRNKVQYDRIDFRVLSTEHFDLYHAPEDLEAARLAVRMAERWYTRLSDVLGHQLSSRQAVVLYGSHRGFGQTNLTPAILEEGTGGFTESRKRRIVLPFSATLAETDHILGHEIVHAFQFDIAARHRTSLHVPLWFVEGMAEYLALGPEDPLTGMWMRDIVGQEKLPAIRDLSAARHFPYRYGAALWSYLTATFGEDLPAKALRARRDAVTRLQTLTGKTEAELTEGWHAWLRERYESPAASREHTGERLIARRGSAGRLNVGAVLSPDGSEIVFLSERDQFSVDVYLADAATGEVKRKLVTTAATAEFESIQYLRSAGAWDPAGERFAMATLRRGRPTLLILDTTGRGHRVDVPLPQFGEVSGPTWRPDGRAIAFSAMRGGASNLHVVELESREVRALTDDLFADVQPAWSPDGRTIAFVTERYSADTGALVFGAPRIALLDVASGVVRPAPALPGSRHINPTWSPDGGSLYVVADRDAISNVYRADLASGTFHQVTDVDTGVSGVTRFSPALSAARDVDALSYVLYRNGSYEIHAVREPAALAGEPLEGALALNGEDAGEPRLTGAAQDAALRAAVQVAAPSDKPLQIRSSAYRPKLSLEAIGPPYFSVGGGSFGNAARFGTYAVFGDLLGNRQLFTIADVSTRIGDSAAQAVFLDRSARWNWGFSVEQVPEIRIRRTLSRFDGGDVSTFVREDERLRRTHRRAVGFVAYPFSRWSRIEMNAGVRHIADDRQVDRRTFAADGGRVISEARHGLPSEPDILLGQAGVALVRDTAIFGPTSPILGSRARLEIAPAFGALTFTQVTADYRQYFMPRRPFTLAFRLLHHGRYGGGAHDLRLREVYLGSPTLVRGYDSGRVRRACQLGDNQCNVMELVGSRLLLAKAELRFPLLNPFSEQISYGRFPIEGLVFADAGTVWSGRSEFAAARPGDVLVRSAGAGVRMHALAFILELSAVRSFDLGRGWSLGINITPGF